MNYKEECKLKAKYLLAAADGVEFEMRNGYGQWEKVTLPDFRGSVEHYRQKPTSKRYNRVLVWFEDRHDTYPLVFWNVREAELHKCMYPSLKEIKRTTITCEVEQ